MYLLISIALLVSASCVYMVEAVLMGKLLARERVLWGRTSWRRRLTMRRHKRKVWSAIYCTLGAVGLIEIYRRIYPRPYVFDTLSIIHYLLDLLLVMLTVVVLAGYTGMYYPRTHRTLAYLVFTTYLFVVVTGGLLFYRSFA